MVGFCAVAGFSLLGLLDLQAVTANVQQSRAVYRIFGDIIFSIKLQR